MKQTIHYRFKDTALGLIAMAATDKGICFLEFGDDQPTLIARLRKEFPQASVLASDPASPPDLEAWTTALSQYLDGKADLPHLPLDVHGTEFEMLVWNALRTIPAGKVLGYSQLAEKVGRPSAVRAVASACGRNRIGVLIPCHRVLRGDGQLGGYRWGLSRKQALLEAENAQVSREMQVKTVS